MYTGQIDGVCALWSIAGGGKRSKKLGESAEGLGARDGVRPGHISLIFPIDKVSGEQDELVPEI